MICSVFDRLEKLMVPTVGSMNLVKHLVKKDKPQLSGEKIQNWFEPPRDKTNKMTVGPAKTHISLGIRPVWSVSLLCTQWIAKDPRFLYADSEDSDQSGRMPRLIWVFAERTCHFVGFVLFFFLHYNKILHVPKVYYVCNSTWWLKFQVSM